MQARLKSDVGINFTEFSYQIFQAYDWLHLLKTYNCNFQVLLNSNHILVFNLIKT